MKNLKRINLASLANTELKEVKGGHVGGSCSCGCACAYADNGGSSTGDNAVANCEGGLASPNQVCEG